jgi:pyruvate,orthophosphate dikinase
MNNINLFGFTKKKPFTKNESAYLKRRELWGGKGANLDEISRLSGVRVPCGFTISTSVCVAYMQADNKQEFMTSIREEILTAYYQIINKMGEGSLVSVRSGARISMAGMMDTILNLGDHTKPLKTRHQADNYRRFLAMFGETALNIPKEEFSETLNTKKTFLGVENDVELTFDHLEELVVDYKEIYYKHGYSDLLEGYTSVEDLLLIAIEAVFKSWNNERAIAYRKDHNIPDTWGTAVNVQAMVFGNMNINSSTGVMFSRCPSTGENHVVGEYLINAQGEDVVAGVRTPQNINPNYDKYEELVTLADSLESHFGDMQDIEFTVMDGTLYTLQTRDGKRSLLAKYKIEMDMASEQGRLPNLDGIHKLKSVSLKEEVEPLTTGVAAGGSLITGVACFSLNQVKEQKLKGVPAILVAEETDPDDYPAMAMATGILTAVGGLTSHSAVVARGMGKTCVVGCSEICVNETSFDITDNVDQTIVSYTDWITIDGLTGKVYEGKLELEETKPQDLVVDFLNKSDSIELYYKTPDQSVETTKTQVVRVADYVTLDEESLEVAVKEIEYTENGTLLIDSRTLEEPISLSWMGIDKTLTELSDEDSSYPITKLRYNATHSNCKILDIGEQISNLKEVIDFRDLPIPNLTKELVSNAFGGDKKLARTTLEALDIQVKEKELTVFTMPKL